MTKWPRTSALPICNDDAAIHLQGPICPADKVPNIYPRQGQHGVVLQSPTAEQYLSIYRGTTTIVEDQGDIPLSYTPFELQRPIMRTAIFALASLVASAAAQSVTIAAPAPSTTLSLGDSFVVDVKRPVCRCHRLLPRTKKR